MAVETENNPILAEGSRSYGLQIRPILIFGVEAGLLWLLLFASRLFLPDFGNDVDVLAYARQFVEPGWLANDWYLNLDQDNRLLFSAMFGWIIPWLGFDTAALTLKLLLLVLLAVTFNYLYRSIRLPFALRVVTLFLYLQRQSLVAGEWMVGAAEAKVIAYALVLLALGMFIKRHPLAGWSAAGLALSFHVLIGAYAGFSILLAFLVSKLIPWPGKKDIAKWSLSFAIFGFFGIRTALLQLQSGLGQSSNFAWQIYVTYRNPHHLLPSAWTTQWEFWLIAATIFFLAVFFLMRHMPEARFLAAFSIAGIGLFIVGLVIWQIDQTQLLRYYWFRLADVMIPFMSLTLLALLSVRLIGPVNELTGSVSGRARSGVQIALVVIAAGVLLYSSGQLLRFLRLSARESRAVLALSDRQLGQAQSTMQWIKVNTPGEAVFLIDPNIEDFYLESERAVFVSYKHIPNSQAAVLEWYELIKIINNGEEPQLPGFETIAELQRGYESLDAESLLQIAQKYRIRYYLARTRVDLTFEELYAAEGFSVYFLPGSEIEQ